VLTYPRRWYNPTMMALWAAVEPMLPAANAARSLGLSPQASWLLMRGRATSVTHSPELQSNRNLPAPDCRFLATRKGIGAVTMKFALQWAGRNGAAVVIAGVLIGIAVPYLSDLARPYLAVAIFIFTFGSFLKFNGATLGDDVGSIRLVSLIVLWATLGIPVVIMLLIAFTHPGPQLAQGLLFWALVPASPACVAFAAILRLNIGIALLGTVIGTAVSPFYIPALAAAFGGYHIDIDPLATCMHLVMLIGGAFLAAIVAKRVAGSFIRQNPEAMTGIAVFAMFLAGMGSMRGMQAHLLAQPGLSVEFALLAYIMLFSAELIGTFLFWRAGRSTALTAGLISGTRTITLAWVVLGGNVLPLADLFLATSMVAKYTAPGLTKWLLARLLAGKPVATGIPVAQDT
jgi:bile acid:Na+ symporter, BASS family